MIPKHKQVRLKGKALADLMKSVYERDGHCCVVCGRWVEDGHKAHHEPAKSKGGQDVIEHLVLLCDKCHYTRHHGTNGYAVREAAENYLNAKYGADRVYL